MFQQSAQDHKLFSSLLPSAFYVGLCAKLNRFSQLRRIFLLFLLLDGGFSSEQIDGSARRKQALMLLPFQRLTQKGE